MNVSPAFAAHVLTIDAAQEVERIADILRDQVYRVLRRRGVVVGLSGGIDSSVCAAVAARALGPQRVLGILMPESESADESVELGRLIAAAIGIPTVLEDITPALRAVGCYERRDEAIRSVVPEFGAGWKSKLVIANASESLIGVSSLVVQPPGGEARKVRLTASAYNQIVAASNFKQRVRAMFEYYHADCRQFAVLGTPNRLEYDQGFFVKNGDGAADLKPIAHLYKTQVYQLGEYLGVPADILRRRSTTDTFSLPQSQEEFYFSIPLEQYDLCLYGKSCGLPAGAIAEATGLTPDQINGIYASIERKRLAASYLHMAPLTLP